MILQLVEVRACLEMSMCDQSNNAGPQLDQKMKLGHATCCPKRWLVYVDQAEGVVGLGSETGEGGGIGSWGGMFGWLLEERVTWADRVAERMKAASLKAWEEKQLARLQAQHHSIKCVLSLPYGDFSP